MHVVVSFDYQKESMRGIFQDFVSWRVETPLAYSKKLSIAHHSKSETHSLYLVLHVGAILYWTLWLKIPCTCVFISDLYSEEVRACVKEKKECYFSGENSESAAAGTFTQHNFIFVIWSFDQGSAWAEVLSIFKKMDVSKVDTLQQTKSTLELLNQIGKWI